MAVELDLPANLAQARWKVKIADKERVEPPHATIIRGASRWRICLRTGGFLDRLPDPDEVPQELLDAIDGNFEWLCEQWDAMYPDNPVESEEE
jgi:hypothetical protein